MTPFPVRSSDPDRVREVDPWELRDPAMFLRDLARVVPLEPGLVVALVHESSTEQRLVRAVRLDGETDVDDPYGQDSEVLHDVAHGLCDGLDPPFPVEYSFVTVVIRDGRCVFSDAEFAMIGAWRYANYVVRVFQGELVLVTPSGWCTFMGHDAGTAPALVPADG